MYVITEKTNTIATYNLFKNSVFTSIDTINDTTKLPLLFHAVTCTYLIIVLK